MIREVTLLPTGQASETVSAGSGASRDPTSGDYYPWNTPTKTLAEVWSDEDNASYWYLWPHKDNGGLASALATFEAAPTLVLIRSLTIRALWSYQMQKGNNWYFPPSNAHAPRARLVLRNRAKSGNNAGAWHELAGAEIVDHYQNASTLSPGTYLGPLTQDLVYTSHPEGGVFTPDDMSPSNLAMGIEVEAAAPAFDNSDGSFAKIRVHRVVCILSVEPLGGYVADARHGAALDLRLWRRPRNTVFLRLPALHDVARVGEYVQLSHPLDAPSVTGAWGIRKLETCPGQVMRKAYLPEQVKVELEVFDRREFACLLWEAYRIDAPWSPELQGLASLRKGNADTHTRAQDAWSMRPVDGVLMRVIEAYPNLSREGLACQDGGDVELCLWNWNLTKTGWSAVAEAGDFAATDDTTVSLVEEQGYLSSCKMVFGATGGAGGSVRSLGTRPRASGALIHARVVVRNTSIVTPATDFAEWYIVRSGGGLAAPEYWDATARGWTTTPAYNAIDSSEVYGMDTSDAIPCDAAGASSDPTYSVAVGRFSSQMGPATIHAALVNVQGGGYGARSPLVTNGSTITRVADVHSIANSAGAEVWAHGRGTVVVEARPYWSADDLPDASVMPLVHAAHASGTWQALQFVASTAGDDVIRFESAVSGEATYQLDCAIPEEVTRAHVLRAWVRWLDSNAWTDYSPYSVEVGYALFVEASGALVSTGSTLGRLAYEGTVAARSAVLVGTNGTAHFDGDVRMLEVRRNPLHRNEAVWRV